MNQIQLFVIKLKLKFKFNNFINLPALDICCSCSISSELLFVLTHTVHFIISTVLRKFRTIFENLKIQIYTTLLAKQCDQID